jgi:phage anti-repressor protein
MKDSQSISVYYSKKGTPYVWANALHKQLGISNDLPSWFNSIIEYGFIENQDYSCHHEITLPLNGSVQYKWAVRLDMAKHIAMLQKSERGRAIRQQLVDLDKKVNTGEFLSHTQLSAIFDLCKILGYFTVQKYAEQKHFAFFNNPKEWWKYRADVLGFSKSDLKCVIETLGEKYRSQQQVLMKIDRYELIRVATIDLLMAIGRSEEYAKNVAKFVKEAAREMKPFIYDDTRMSISFKNNEENKIIDKIKNGNSPMLLGQF